MFWLNEGGSFRRSVTFRDEAEDVYVPTTVEYSVMCETNNRTISTWASVTPASTIEFTLNGTVNNILNRANRRERKSLNVRIDYGLPTAKVGVYQWEVRRIQDPSESTPSEPFYQDGYGS